GHSFLLNGGPPNSYDVEPTRGDNETARVLIASRRGCDGVAVNGARTADNAGGWVSPQFVRRIVRAGAAYLSPRPRRNRLRRRPQRVDRISLGERSKRPAPRIGGRPGASWSQRHCCARKHAGSTGGKSGNRKDSRGLPGWNRSCRG